MKFTAGGDEFPSACVFCGHTRLAEGICQCPPDCPSCAAGASDPAMASCCGRAVTVAARGHGAAVAGLPWPDGLIEVKVWLQCECGWHASYDGPVTLEAMNAQWLAHVGAGAG